jgi:hypothetical protein
MIRRTCFTFPAIVIPSAPTRRLASKEAMFRLRAVRGLRRRRDGSGRDDKCELMWGSSYLASLPNTEVEGEKEEEERNRGEKLNSPAPQAQRRAWRRASGEMWWTNSKGPSPIARPDPRPLAVVDVKLELGFLCS